jgi:hypothetical protein
VTGDSRTPTCPTAGEYLFCNLAGFDRTNLGVAQGLTGSRMSIIMFMHICHLLA